MSVDKRRGGYNCPICSGRRIVVGQNDLATTHPHLLSEWCYEKNIDTSPEQITFGSQQKVWWQCELGHTYLMRVCHKVSGIGCPICSGKIVLAGFNDLATQYPELLLEWDYEKNIISPTEVSSGCHTKVWWRCEKDHGWQASINNRTNNKTTCPICAASVRVTNMGNTKNTSGVIGVSLYKPTQKWHAEIQYNKMPMSLKYYDNKDDAIRARLEAEIQYYGYDNAPQRHLFEQYNINVDGGDLDA